MKKNKSFWILPLAIAMLAVGACKETSTPEIETNQQETNDAKESTLDPIATVNQYLPPVFFVTSYRCRSCGSFGKPVTEQLVAEMGDSLLPVVIHVKYGDPFENQTSFDLVEALGTNLSTPQIWWENENKIFDLFSRGKGGSVNYLKEEIRKERTNEAKAKLGIAANLKENGRWDVTYTVENGLESEHNYTVEIYAMEDDLLSIQKGAEEEEDQLHHQVNRGGFYGEMGKEIQLTSKGSFTEQIEVIPCVACNENNLYFMAIVWKANEDGTYTYINGLVHKP